MELFWGAGTGVVELSPVAGGNDTILLSMDDQQRQGAVFYPFKVGEFVSREHSMGRGEEGKGGGERGKENQSFCGGFLGEGEGGA